MVQMLTAMIFPIVIGIIMGCAYTNGALLGQSLFKCCNYLLLGLSSLVLLSCAMAWMKLGFACSVALGITLLVCFKLRWNRPQVPAQLSGSLAARPGEQEPDIFPTADQGWQLVYPDGVCLSYNAAGEFLAIE